MVYKFEGENVIQYNRGLLEEPVQLDVIDLTGTAEYEARIEEEANRIQEGMDIVNGRMMNLGLFKTDEGDHLMVAIHHLVVDGVSWRILLEDFEAAYKQLEAGTEIVLPEKTHSFKEWARRLSEYANSREMAGELEYWKKVSATSVKPLPRG